MKKVLHIFTKDVAFEAVWSIDTHDRISQGKTLERNNDDGCGS
jgi:hypothetical protein